MNKKKTLVVVKSIQDSRKLLKALGNLSNVTNDVEEHFTDELHVFFQYLGRKIVSNVDLDQPLDAIFYQQVDSVIDDYWKEYEEILSTYVDKAYQVGIVHSKLLLSASKDYAKRYESLKSEDKELFFKPNAKVSKRLKTYKFEASEHTKSRVTDEINNTLGEAYREGWGRENVTKRIQQKFNDLATWESRRIAVTEVNSARNLAHYNQLIEDNIAYQKWIPSKDEKVRDSHKMHPIGVGGEIVPVGERFSNGLLHPGDKEGGPIKEWVNCRCTVVAFIIPLGYEAPSFWPFFEEDLVKVGSTNPKDYLKLPSDVIETPEVIIPDKYEIGIMPQKAEKALDDFNRKIGANKNEHAMYVSDDGTCSRIVKGNWGEVRVPTSISEDWVKEQNALGNAVHFTHNHPTEWKMLKIEEEHRTLLSDSDFEWFLKYNHRGLDVASYSAEGPYNRFTASKLPNFNQFTFAEQDKKWSYAYREVENFIDKWYRKSPTPGIVKLRQVKSDLSAQGIDWRQFSRENPEEWAKINDDIKKECDELRNQEHTQLVKKMNEIMNPVGIKFESKLRKPLSLKFRTNLLLSLKAKKSKEGMIVDDKEYNEILMIYFEKQNL